MLLQHHFIVQIICISLKNLTQKIETTPKNLFLNCSCKLLSDSQRGGGGFGRGGDPGMYGGPGMQQGYADPQPGDTPPQGCVLMVYGLSPEHMNCDRVFNLFCLYGNVCRVSKCNTVF